MTARSWYTYSFICRRPDGTLAYYQREAVQDGSEPIEATDANRWDLTSLFTQDYLRREASEWLANPCVEANAAWADVPAGETLVAQTLCQDWSRRD